jgi:predicted nucleotidyltransferase
MTMNAAVLEATLQRQLSCLTPEQLRELAGLVERLIVALYPEQIDVFGSQARGDAGPDSDVDLLIVVPPTDIPGHRLSQQAYRAAGEHPLSLDRLVMPTDEFAWRRRSPASLPSTVLREGKLIYAT